MPEAGAGSSAGEFPSAGAAASDSVVVVPDVSFGFGSADVPDVGTSDSVVGLCVDAGVDEAGVDSGEGGDDDSGSSLLVMRFCTKENTGLISKELPPTAMPIDFLNKEVDKLMTISRANSIVTRLAITPREARREAFRFPANNKIHDSGMAVRLTVDMTMPKILLGENHGKRLFRSSRTRRDWAS